MGPLVLAALMFAVAVAGATLARERDRSNEAYDFRSDVGPAITNLAARLDDELVRTAALAGSLPPGPKVDAAFDAAVTRLFPSSASGVAVLDRQGRGVGVAAGDSEGLLAIAGDSAAQVAFEQARDRGLPQVAAIEGDDGAAAVAIAARYRSGAVLIDTAGRRAALEGYVARAVPVDALTGDILDEATGGLAASRVTDGGLVLSEAGESAERGDDPRTPTVHHRMRVAGRTWDVNVWRDPPFSPGWLLSGTIVGAGVVAGAGALVIGSSAVRSRRRAEGEAGARRRDLALVAEIGPVLQRSLELADVLPPVVIALADELELAGIGVSAADSMGRFHELFALGTPPDRTLARLDDLPPPVDEVGANEEFVVPLQRAGRVIGVLRARPRRPVSRDRMESVRAVAELVAATLANAGLYEREQETVRRLQEVDELKTAFLGTASHELRTPVTAIRGFSELLDRSWDELDDQQRRDFVSRIARNADSLGSLVQDLLDFARLGQGGLQVRGDALSLTSAVRAIVDKNSNLLDAHDLDLQLDTDVVALADPVAVERIATNLVSNAAKFSPPGTTVTVVVDRVDDRARLLVDDEGPGVRPSERERIFSRFYRGGGDQALRTRGAGIGLSVVKDLAEQLGATVAVTESPAGGARFEVRFLLPPPDSGGALLDVAGGGRDEPSA